MSTFKVGQLVKIPEVGGRYVGQFATVIWDPSPDNGPDYVTVRTQHAVGGEVVHDIERADVVAVERVIETTNRGYSIGYEETEDLRDFAQEWADHLDDIPEPNGVDYL